VRETTAVIPAIASALALQPHGGLAILESLAAACAGRRTLLVLDNFEQVVSAAPALTRLAAAAPGVKLLVTSRMRLGVRAEHEFFVAPLAVPDEQVDAAALRENAAVRLFVRRASSANPALVWDDDTLRASARVCMRLDGLPLAIELAAARCRLMSPSALAARVEDGFDLLSGGSRDMPERHRTIRRTVAWSVALLGPMKSGSGRA
jgi:predicted ATPase